MRRPLIAGNWKMNTTIGEALSLVKQMLGDLLAIDSVDKVICPPFVSLSEIRDLTEGTSVRLGAQNMYFKEKGAFTGEISPLMLRNLCKYVILGHSERRQYFGETDATVNEKVRAALNFNLLPILCIGETLEENEAGKTNSVLERQVKEGLKDITATKDLVLAYEPIWAIGTGKAATGVQAGKTIGFIRSTLSALWGKDLASAVRILYGGSVTGANITEFMKEPEIDGGLVGGASLKAEEFIDIVRQTAAAKG
jgi:triosephosphate isomerase (TIM)